MSDRLVVPANITIVPLPAKCPELNPVENVWQFMRDNWLSNRVFGSYTAIVDHCCNAWNKLANRPWRVAAFVPAAVFAVVIYAVVRAATMLPIQMTLGRLTSVLAILLVMSAGSALLSIRVVGRADRVDLF